MSQTALSRILCDFVQDIDGHLYGTTAYGGSLTVCGFSGCGTIFKITSNGTLSTEYIFCPQAPCTNGNYPASRLLLAIDGNPFGTTDECGAVNWVSVYKFNRRARYPRSTAFCASNVFRKATVLWISVALLLISLPSS